MPLMPLTCQAIIIVFNEYADFQQGTPGQPIFNMAPAGPGGPNIRVANMPGPQGEAGRPGQPGMAEDGAGPPSTDTNTGEEELQEPDRIRTEFPETWIWTEETVG